ncbi:TBC1 domain family member whacked-like [Clavelina lepadiformis]|uniref:TBC1 domain family member whacked-like n=1 Tax=Clavelina lepadiformis TaxID=159417 RepID=UPI0040415EB8
MSLTMEPEGFSDIPSQAESDDYPSTSKTDVETDKYGFTGGTQYTDPDSEDISAAKLRERESKWLRMLDNWNKWMSKKFPKVKQRCRKGIPSSLRGRAWQLLCGSKQLHSQQPKQYQELLNMEATQHDVECIEKDLHRQFPFHEMFAQRGGTGQQDLHDVLYAYSNYNRGDGYCQAQAPVAAVLLMHMPAEEAFWCMVAMFEYYIPGYYSPGLEVVQVDGNIMQGLLKKVAPYAYKHLEKHNVSPMLYCTEWFMCIFSRTLPWPSVLRLWDMFFCEGIKIIFRCGLVLLRSTIGQPQTLKKLPGLYETMERLRGIDMVIMQPERLMFQIINLKIDEEDLEAEHKRQQKIWKKQHPSEAKDVKRLFRYTPTHSRSRSVSQPSAIKTKKKLNTVSVNTPEMLQQAAEYEKNTLRPKKSPPKAQQNGPVQLTEFKKYSDDNHLLYTANGSVKGKQSQDRNAAKSLPEIHLNESDNASPSSRAGAQVKTKGSAL